MDLQRDQNYSLNGLNWVELGHSFRPVSKLSYALWGINLPLKHLGNIYLIPVEEECFDSSFLKEMLDFFSVGL